MDGLLRFKKKKKSYTVELVFFFLAHLVMSRENSVCWSTFLGVVLWCVFIHLYKPTERHVLRSRPYVSWGPGAAQHRLQRLWFGQEEEEEEGCPGAAAAEDGGRKTR